MATWKSKTYTFKLETYPPESYGYGVWADVEFRWDYNTTSDCIAIYSKEPNSEEARELFSQEGAVAQLVTMMDWYMVYNGQEALDKLVSDLKKEHGDGT